MKKLTKILTLTLCVVMLLSFGACGKKATLANKGFLTMGTNAAFPPYEYYEGEEIVGIDVEIAGAIAKKLDLELKVEDMEFDAVNLAVKSGKVDIGFAGMTVNPERLEVISFTDSYATGLQVVIVPEGSPITSVDDLFADGANHLVGVQRGTTGDIYATGDIEDAGLGTLERFASGAEAVLSLTTGKIDCVIIDNEPAKAFVEANEGLKILETEYVLEDYAASIAQDNEILLEQVNEAMKELKEDGTIADILAKYINAD